MCFDKSNLIFEGRKEKDLNFLLYEGIQTITTIKSNI